MRLVRYTFGLTFYVHVILIDLVLGVVRCRQQLGERAHYTEGAEFIDFVFEGIPVPATTGRKDITPTVRLWADRYRQ